MSSCVYIVECQGLYKIGKTTDLKARLLAIQAMNPFPLKVVHVIPSEQYGIVEKALHKIFSSKRLGGEWFELSPEELNEVKSLSVQDIVARASRIETTPSRISQTSVSDTELQPDIPVPHTGDVIVPFEVMRQAYSFDKPRRALFGSFLRLLTLGWKSKYKQTPRISEEALIRFLRLSRRQYIEQKNNMLELGWITESYRSLGEVAFEFPHAVEYDEEVPS